jgi:phosphate-selective porin
MRPHCVAIIVAIVLCTGRPAPADAQEGERTETAADQTAAPRLELEPPPKNGLVWSGRPSLRFGRLFRFDITARFQEDIRDSYAGADVLAGLDVFHLQRKRIGLQGRVFRHLQFEFERELVRATLTSEEAAEGLSPATPWKDVWVEFDAFKQAEVRVGRFKVPFGLDALTSASEIDFVHRTLGAEYLAPGRDSGVMIHGRLRRGLEYAAGGFKHDGDNARTTRIAGADRTYAGRVTAEPLRFAPAWIGSVTLGAAVAVSSLRNEAFQPNGLRGRTVVTDDTFFEPLYVNGDRRRWGLDVDWMAGPASLRAEYTHAIDTRLGQGIGGADLPDARYRSWYIGGTYLVTGEKKSRPLRPRAEFLRGGAGAVELAGRYERFWQDGVGGGDTPLRNPRAETIAPNGERVFTAGVAWILNRWIKVQFNGVRERIDDAARSPVGGGAFWSQIFRVQVAL